MKISMRLITTEGSEKITRDICALLGTERFSISGLYQ